MPGSFFSLDRHSGFFFASFLAFLCFATDAFSILCLRRTGVRLDFFSVGWVSAYRVCQIVRNLGVIQDGNLLPGLLTPAISV